MDFFGKLFKIALFSPKMGQKPPGASFGTRYFVLLEPLYFRLTHLDYGNTVAEVILFLEECSVLGKFEELYFNQNPRDGSSLWRIFLFLHVNVSVGLYGTSLPNEKRYRPEIWYRHSPRPNLKAGFF